MKKYLLLLLLCNYSYAVTILSERSWVTGPNAIRGEVHHINSMDVARSGLVLLDQFGYQGVENNITGTHTFYLYSGDGGDLHYTLKATLCDQRNNCFHYEKKILVEWRHTYSDTVISSFTLSSENIGKEKITATTEITDNYPNDKIKKEAAFLLSPFPYD